MLKKGLYSILSVLILSATCYAPLTLGQTEDNDELKRLSREVESLKPGTTSFLMRGYAHAGFENIEGESSFVTGTFAPIFLWTQGDHILFEAEAEISYSESGTSFALEYANIAYILNDYFIVRFGNFLTPFGIFGERLHPNWINKFPSNPLGFNHHNPVGPFSEVGMELRGGAPIGNSRLNYAFYLSNGPNFSVDATVAPLQVGTSYQNYHDNNDNKAVGGRIGILPFSNSALELGASGQYANIGDRDTGYEEVSSLMYSADLTFVKNSLSPIQGSIDLKGQWNYVDEDEVNIVDSGGNITNVDNDMSAYFVMLSYRPNLLSSKFLSRMELVARYSVFNVINESSFISSDGHDDHTHKELPGGTLSKTTNALTAASQLQAAAAAGDQGALNEDKTQWAFGLNYWISWRSLLKASYQVTSNTEDINGFFIHYALGF